MGYAKFLKWVGEQALKNKVLQPYLNKAWREAEKAGKPIIEKNFPSLLKKAQDFKANFKTFEPKIVPKVVKPKIVKPKQLDKNFIRISKDQIDDIERSIANKPKTLADALKTGKYKTVPTPKGLKPPSLRKSNIIPFPKKSPGKADGGRIDKALPTRSRDI